MPDKSSKRNHANRKAFSPPRVRFRIPQASRMRLVTRTSGLEHFTDTRVSPRFPRIIQNKNRYVSRRHHKSHSGETLPISRRARVSPMVGYEHLWPPLTNTRLTQYQDTITGPPGVWSYRTWDGALNNPKVTTGNRNWDRNIACSVGNERSKVDGLVDKFTHAVQNTASPFRWLLFDVIANVACECNPSS